MKKWIAVLSVIIVIIAAVLGLKVRYSYTDIINEIDDKGNCPVLNVHFPDSGMDFDILESADLVAKIKIAEEGIQKYKCTYFKAYVEKVYKGDKSLEQNYIGVFQNAFFSCLETASDKTLYYINDSTFNMMLLNQEYYVAMYEKEFIQLYQNEFGARTFTFVPDYYALMPVEMGELHWFETSELKYKDVCDYPYLCLTKKGAQAIEKNRKQTLVFLGIED